MQTIQKNRQKNTIQDIKRGYNTHRQRTGTGGLVQLILSPIELFLSGSFAAYSNWFNFGLGTTFFLSSTEDKIQKGYVLYKTRNYGR
jgi:hypothetical protein